MPARPALVTPAAVVDAAPLRALIAAGADQFRGRLAVFRALALAAICARPVNVLLIGPPGTAKTTIARQWAACLGARFMGATLSPWTDAAELLGPVDLAALAANRLERARSPSRPTLLDADLALLDEFPRAAPGIRAMVMSALSDRLTPVGDPVPAHVIVAGANTRLTSEEDRATVDRFHLRVEVARLMGASDLRTVITREVTVDGAAASSAPLPALPPGLVEALRAQSAAVDVPGDVADALVSLALALRQPAPSGAAYPDVSERRWVATTRILQASATLAGRSSVDWTDLVDTLPMVLDDGAESRPAVTAALNASIPRWVRALTDLDAACLAAVERARRAGAASSAPGIEPMRPGDADAHVKLDAELDELIKPLRSFGADVVKRGETRADTCRDDAADAYAEGVAASKAARKASR